MAKKNALMNEEALLKKLREAFRLESAERLTNLSAGLLDLEKADTDELRHPLLEAVFREAHSLKGAARAVNLMEIESLCQSVEGLFAALKKKSFPLSPAIFDTLHESVRVIESFLTEPSAHHKNEIEGLLFRLDELKHKGEFADKPALLRESAPLPVQEAKVNVREQRADNIRESKAKVRDSVSDNIREPKAESRHPQSVLPAKLPISETVRIAASKLDKLLLQAEELSSLKLASNLRVLNLREVANSFAQWKKQWNRMESEFRILRTQVQREKSSESRGTDSDALAGLMSFADWTHEHNEALGREIRRITKAAESDHRVFSKMVNDLSDDMKKVMMLPFSTLFEIFPRMVRDLSRNQGKETDLTIEGGEIEIDRRILEEIKDPLIHLLRNAVDHGLETPELRHKRGKPGHGTVRLRVSRSESSKIEIVLSDDGNGIDLDQIREQAVASGILSRKESENLKETEALTLIFRSGISSSKIITEISGRGLGLAIVQEKIEKLGGRLSVETAWEKGSCFRMQLPVTLATFRGILIRAANAFFIVPGAQVERVLKIRLDQVKTVENMPTVFFDSQVVPLAELAAVLKISSHSRVPADEQENSDFLIVMILGTGQKRVAFQVDEVLSEQEVLVKSLGRQLSRVPNIAGAAILGNGKAAPILNVHDLLKSAAYENMVYARRTSASRTEAETKRHAILVAEDSITSRILIKNILEAAGYAVKTAVDGRDAYTILKSEAFDAVISDVEMPRMNGFELTEHIRKNGKLADTPVILLTNLDSREDRERGIDVGASAYLVKTGFDQSNLLDIIGRLI